MTAPDPPRACDVPLIFRRLGAVLPRTRGPPASAPTAVSHLASPANSLRLTDRDGGRHRRQLAFGRPRRLPRMTFRLHRPSGVQRRRYDLFRRDDRAPNSRGPMPRSGSRIRAASGKRPAHPGRCVRCMRASDRGPKPRRQIPIVGSGPMLTNGPAPAPTVIFSRPSAMSPAARHRYLVPPRFRALSNSLMKRWPADAVRWPPTWGNPNWWRTAPAACLPGGG